MLTPLTPVQSATKTEAISTAYHCGWPGMCVYVLHAYRLRVVVIEGSVCMCVYVYVCACGCMFGCMFGGMWGCMCDCMCGCMYGCMWECV